MYRILTEQRKAAQRLGVTIRPSTLKNKKLDVYKNGFKVASIGDKRYKDYWVYKKLERQGKIPKGTADERRELYLIRHAENCMTKGTPGYYACKILW
jgi:hypothetical protein